MAGSGVSDKFDSKSFHSLLSNPDLDVRSYVYTEKSTDGNVSYAVRDSQFKLIVDADGTESIYDLKNDPYERTNLLADPSSSISEVRNALSQEALQIRK